MHTVINSYTKKIVPFRTRKKKNGKRGLGFMPVKYVKQSPLALP